MLARLGNLSSYSLDRSKSRRPSSFENAQKSWNCRGFASFRRPASAQLKVWQLLGRRIPAVCRPGLGIKIMSERIIEVSGCACRISGLPGCKKPLDSGGRVSGRAPQNTGKQPGEGGFGLAQGGRVQARVTNGRGRGFAGPVFSPVFAGEPDRAGGLILHLYTCIGPRVSSRGYSPIVPKDKYPSCLISICRSCSPRDRHKSF